MNRRQAIKTTFTAAALASVLRPGVFAQETPAKPAAVEGNTLYLNPATGADTNLYLDFHPPCLAQANQEDGVVLPPAGGRTTANAGT